MQHPRNGPPRCRAAILAGWAGAATALAGCASDVSLSDRLAGSDRVRGDAEHVRVFEANSVAEALPLAVGHCAKFHSSAQYARREGGAYVFRCVRG